MKSALKYLLWIAAGFVTLVFLVNVVKVKGGKAPLATAAVKKVIKEYELAMTDESLAVNWAGQSMSCWSPQDKNHPGPDTAKWSYSVGKKGETPSASGSFDTIGEMNVEIGEKFGMTYRIKRSVMTQAAIDTWAWFSSFLE